MTIKRVTVSVDHTFDIDIPDELLDEDSWSLSDYVYDIFMNDEDNWDDVDIDINDIKERN